MNEVADVILVGDSLGMVVLGYDSTTQVTMEDMLSASGAVARGAARPFIVADLPFGSYTTPGAAVANAVRLLQTGRAQGVKLEGGASQVAKIAAIAGEGIPVMAHIGLLPQTAPSHGGYALQGGTPESALALVADALAVQAAGATSVVLEKVPAQLAAYITGLLRIPTIGIGAGPHCSGQVLVSHDLLGLYPRPPPRFVKTYAAIYGDMQRAFGAYCADVRTGAFPEASAPTYHFLMKPEHAATLRRELAAAAVPAAASGDGGDAAATTARAAALAAFDVAQLLAEAHARRQAAAAATIESPLPSITISAGSPSPLPPPQQQQQQSVTDAL